MEWEPEQAHALEADVHRGHQINQLEFGQIYHSPDPYEVQEKYLDHSNRSLSVYDGGPVIQSAQPVPRRTGDTGNKALAFRARSMPGGYQYDAWNEAIAIQEASVSGRQQDNAWSEASPSHAPAYLDPQVYDEEHRIFEELSNLGPHQSRARNEHFDFQEAYLCNIRNSVLASRARSASSLHQGNTRGEVLAFAAATAPRSMLGTRS